jgi:outer membrane protein assembly factor BamB
MKKTLLLISLIFLTISCSKKEIAKGKRISVFSYKDVLKESKDVEIKIPDEKINKNYFGNSSVLNTRIENFYLDKNLDDKKIKFKKYKLGFKPIGKRYKIFAPVVYKNIAYIMSPNGVLYAKDLAKPKKILWKSKLLDKKVLRDFSFAKISYSNERIIISTGYNEIISVYTKNGEIDWIKKLNSVPISSPVIYKNSIYIITNNNRLYALNERNGEIKWIHSGISKGTAISGSANPVIYNNTVFASYSSGEIYAVDINNGITIWSKTLSSNVYNFTSFELSDIDATPIIKDEKIYVISNSGNLICANVNNGKILWEKKFSSITNFWIAENGLYIMNNDNVLSCVEINNGIIKWAQKLPKYRKEKKKKGLIFYRDIVMANQKLLLFNNQNKMIIVSPKDGKIIKEVKIKHNVFDSPIFINGHMYLSATKRLKTRLIEVY